MSLHHFLNSFRPLLPALLTLALVAPACAQASKVEGLLERGPTHSVLWFVSPESGDLVGQVFANASPAGQIILAACLPGLHCVAEGANAVEPPEDLTRQLRFSSEPSGWWLITQARSAGMQGDLPLHERTLRTRYGLLDVNENHMLLLEGRPVLGNPQPPGASAATAPAPAAAPSLMARLSTWWQGQWHRVMALLGLGSTSLPAASTAKTPAPTVSDTPWHVPGTAEVVQGNNTLHLVAHYELEGQDVALLQDTGGAYCPALFRFAMLSAQGIAVTPAFGTCNDIAHATLAQDAQGRPEPILAMPGFLGPDEPKQAREQASNQLQRFALRQGQVVALDPSVR